MTTAYDLKDLGARLQKAGLPIAVDALETTAAKVYEELMAWVVESAKLSPNKIDDVFIPFKGYVDELVLPQIDKINGRKG